MKARMASFEIFWNTGLLEYPSLETNNNLLGLGYPIGLGTAPPSHECLDGSARLVLRCSRHSYSESSQDAMPKSAFLSTYELRGPGSSREDLEQ